VDRPGREPGGRRPVRDREVAPGRGPGPHHDREGPARAWFTLETLTAAIGKAKADGSIARAVTRICRSDLIVVDDIGMLPAGQDAAEAFYRITDAAYERRSVAVTSNIHPSGFDTIMPKTLATATVDNRSTRRFLRSCQDRMFACQLVSAS
jgi:DNA replication protein DnaC